MNALVQDRKRNEIRPTTGRHFEIVDALRQQLAAAKEATGDFRDKYRLALLGIPIVGIIGLLIGLILGKHYG